MAFFYFILENTFIWGALIWELDAPLTPKKSE